MHPYRCSKCQKTIHTFDLIKAKCCPGAVFEPLVKICLLVVESEAEGKPLIHQTGEFHLPSPTGRKWATACGAKKLPPVTSRVPEACTCKKCLDWYSKKLEEHRQAEMESEIEIEV